MKSSIYRAVFKSPIFKVPAVFFAYTGWNTMLRDARKVKWKEMWDHYDGMIDRMVDEHQDEDK